jgi:hypothetical protein
MSFPKFNLRVMILDVPPNKTFNLSPLLYLPLKKSKQLFKHFTGSSRKQHLFIRLCSLPSLIKNILNPFVNEMSTQIFSVMNSNIDIFTQIDLSSLQSCIQVSPHKQRLLKWKRKIRKITKWDENHSVHGKYLILCSFILCHSFSENDFKVQFRLMKSSS